MFLFTKKKNDSQYVLLIFNIYFQKIMKKQLKLTPKKFLRLKIALFLANEYWKIILFTDYGSRRNLCDATRMLEFTIVITSTSTEKHFAESEKCERESVKESDILERSNFSSVKIGQYKAGQEFFSPVNCKRFLSIYVLW